MRISVAIGISLLFVVPTVGQDKKKPDAKQIIKLPFGENFRKVKIGDIPKGWTGADALGTRRFRGLSGIQPAAKGFHHLETPPLSIDANFRMEISAHLNYSGEMEIVLKGRGTNPDLTIKMQQFVGIATNWRVTVEKNTPKTLPIPINRPTFVRVDRDGSRFVVRVNGQTVFARRISTMGKFEGIRFGLSGPTEDRGTSTATLLSVSLQKTK